MRNPHIFCYAKGQNAEEVAIMELGSILNVTGFFLLRIGLPVVLLVVLGMLIDRWQRARRSAVDTAEFDSLENSANHHEHGH